MEKKLWIIGDSFTGLYEDTWVKILCDNFKGNYFVSSQSSRDFQSVLDCFLRKLKDIKPLTFGQALRIDGVTPAAINILMIYCKNTLRKAS